MSGRITQAALMPIALALAEAATVSLFERQAKSGANPELRPFAKQLPIVQEHLKLARVLPGQR
jgi:hypothetical protein